MIPADGGAASGSSGSSETRARAARCWRSRPLNCSARATSATALAEIESFLPVSKSVYQFTLIPAIAATSSRRRPGARRRPRVAGSPTSSGRKRARRLFRKAESSCRRSSSEVDSTPRRSRWRFPTTATCTTRGGWLRSRNACTLGWCVKIISTSSSSAAVPLVSGRRSEPGRREPAFS